MYGELNEDQEFDATIQDLMLWLIHPFILVLGPSTQQPTTPSQADHMRASIETPTSNRMGGTFGPN
jgi:hypothetical protein